MPEQSDSKTEKKITTDDIPEALDYSRGLSSQLDAQMRSVEGKLGDEPQTTEFQTLQKQKQILDSFVGNPTLLNEGEVKIIIEAADSQTKVIDMLRGKVESE